jgi:hypothetical protein
MRDSPRTRAFFDFVVSEMRSFRALLLGKRIPLSDAVGAQANKRGSL